jgi:hypothetical protein
MSVSYYGLHGDPEEQHPHPANDDEGRAFEERMRRHVAELRRVRAALPREGGGGPPVLSEETRRQLRALGYVRD